jgi:Uncharacterized protein conserved in bacteria
MNAAAPQKPSDAWRNFTYAQMGASLVVLASIIAWSPMDDLVKVSLGVTTAWALTNAVSITKLLRDKQEREDWEAANRPEPVRPARAPSTLAGN